MKTIIRNNRFTFADLDNALKNREPGTYEIVWVTPSAEYSTKVQWDGNEYHDVTDWLDKTGFGDA